MRVVHTPKEVIPLGRHSIIFIILSIKLKYHIFNSRYTSTVPNGSAATTIVSGVSTPGEYIQLELPHKVKLSSIRVLGNQENTTNLASRSPVNAVLAGSNDGITWTTVLTYAGASWTTLTEFKSFPANVEFSRTYKYFRFIGTKNGGSTMISIQNFEFYGTGVDSIPLQIGGGNIDKVANFRVYDKFVGEDQALEIWDAQKDYFGRAKSSMTLYKGRLGIGTTEPEGRLAVLDEPHNLEEFPPRAMTGYKNHFEGHGEFCASASSKYIASGSTVATYVAYQAFDRGHHVDGDSWRSITWNSVSPSYNASTRLVSTGASLGGYAGEWLKLSLPYGVKISGYQLAIRSAWSSYCPDDWVILGSNDDKNWVLVSSVTSGGIAPGSSGDAILTKDFVVETTKHYKYLALVCRKVAGGVNQVNFAELRYFGTREQGQSVLHDGQLTLTKNLNVPRIGPALDADDTPRRDRLVVEYNTSTNPTFEGAVRDTSGRGFDGVFVGTASYDATQKDLTFDGKSNQLNNISTTTTITGGDWVNSVSVWFKVDEAHTNLNDIFTIGPTTTTILAPVHLSGFYIVIGYI